MGLTEQKVSPPHSNTKNYSINFYCVKPFQSVATMTNSIYLMSISRNEHFLITKGVPLWKASLDKNVESTESENREDTMICK